MSFMTKIFGGPVDTPTGQKLMQDYAIQCGQAMSDKYAGMQNAAAQQSLINPMGPNYAQGIGATTATHQSLMNQMAASQMNALDINARNLHVNIREIRNGYLVRFGRDEVFIKELSEISPLVSVEMAKICLGE